MSTERVRTQPQSGLMAAKRELVKMPEGMALIPRGMFLMGSNSFYPEERPVHRVRVDEFWIDKVPVTNASFSRFVEATRYVTFAERPPNPDDYPGAKPELLVPGSLVFRKPSHRVDLHNCHNWWEYVPGADWKHPEGPGSDLNGRDNHPVVQVAYEDAQAFARWMGKELPTEAEWEFAARGGLEGAIFAWGDEFAPDGKIMANTWQGEFPWLNLKRNEGTSPVGSYPANGYGLFDMCGNVWEWTCDYYSPMHSAEVIKPCCIPINPRVNSDAQSFLVGQPGGNIPRRVVKGGSHLCAPNYCLRYRPAARQGEPLDSSSTHIGFRCIVRSNRQSDATLRFSAEHSDRAAVLSADK
jgi:formylglycine-generating enzyme